MTAKRGRREKNLTVTCNALYKKADTFNCKLLPAQAIELARHLLAKAQEIMDGDECGLAVHLWNKGAQNEVLYLGTDPARKGVRREMARA